MLMDIVDDSNVLLGTPFSTGIFISGPEFRIHAQHTLWKARVILM